MVIRYAIDSEPEEGDAKSLIEPNRPEDTDLPADLVMWGFVPWSRFGFGGRSLLGLPKVWLPSVDVFRREGNIVVQADLPGMEMGDIEVSVEDNQLIIRGHRQESAEITKDNYQCLERATGDFYRAVRLPEDVLLDAIEATYNNGVLEVIIPLSEPVRDESFKVAIKEIDPNTSTRKNPT